MQAAKLRPSYPLLSMALLFCLTLAPVHPALAQVCNTPGGGSVQLINQAQVNSFQVDYGPCDTVPIGLTIAEATLDDQITNLAGLSDLVRVDGNLAIERNTQLTNLSGLENITSVGLAVGIRNNDELRSLDGLSGLTTIGSVLDIRRNPELQNIDALSNLSSVAGVSIDTNDSLTNVDGLTGLSEIGDGVSGNLGFFRTPVSTLRGLANITRIDGNLFIRDITATSLAGLDQLSAIGGGLLLDGNPNLQSLDGLEQLDSIRLDLTVQNNFALTDCAALAPVLGFPVIPHDPAGDGVGEDVTIASSNGVGARSPNDCLNAFSGPAGQTVGGTVTGLTGTGLTLENNGEALPITMNGPFTFPTPVAEGAGYAVSITSDPGGQQCTLSNGSGTIQGAPVTNVAVACTDLARSFTGTLPSGMAGSIGFTTTDPTCAFADDPQFLDEQGVSPAPPANLQFVDGVVDFTVSGCAPGARILVTVNYGAALAADTEYWKIRGGAWERIDAAIQGPAISFIITDGGPNDQDGTVNGQIVDPGGATGPTGNSGPPGPQPPDTAPATPVPMNPAWALWLLIGLLGGLGALTINRRAG